MPRAQQPVFFGGDSESGVEGRPVSGEAPTAVRRVRALEFIRPMRGASHPLLLRCEGGESYVVKFQDNPQHVRVLANEMLASRLALLIGLPIPTPAFVEVPDVVTAQCLSREAGSLGKRYVPALQFGSRFPGDSSQILVVDFLPDRLLRRVKGLEAVFLGGFLFDKWTCNCDGRQVIFYRSADEEGSSYSASLIDHGFCFNDGEWNFPDSPIRGLYPRRLVYESVRGLSSFEPFLSRVENLKRAELEACAEGIPADWCGKNPGELKQVVDRLYERRRGLRQAIVDAKNSALRPFPHWE